MSNPSPPEVLVHELHRDRAVGHGRDHPLDRVAAHVPRGEDAGQRGLEQERPAAQPPPAGRFEVGAAERRAGADEAATVEGDAVGEPAGARLGADEDEQRRGLDPPPTAVAGTEMRAPNFSAWIEARLASSSPETPLGKPR